MRRLTQAQIVQIIAGEFPCFGRGSHLALNNPIAEVLSDRPAQFAAGVDVATVVNRVIELTQLSAAGEK